MAKYPNAIPVDELKASIARLKDYCNSHGWQVQYSPKNHDYCHKRVIYLYKNHTAEIEYYSLMHEIGHLLMLDHDFTYPSRYPENSKRHYAYNTSCFRIERLKEEIEAWEVGESIVRSLGLRVNPLNLKKEKSGSLIHYMLWAVQPAVNRKKNKVKKVQEELARKKEEEKEKKRLTVKVSKKKKNNSSKKKASKRTGSR